MLQRTKICTGVLACLGAHVLGMGVPLAHAQSTERIEITGSKTKRVDAETLQPVATIRREDPSAAARHRSVSSCPRCP